MTDKYDERAAEIVIKYTNGYHMGAMPQVHVLLEMIAAALRDAVEEAFTNGFEECNKEIPGIEKEATAAAFADATKIVEDFECNSRWIPNGIADRIRARAQEL